MQKITPCLWFDGKAEEAVNFYSSIFENSKILGTTHYEEAGSKVSGQTKGTVMTVLFQLAGQEFMALNGGPIFSFSPAVSFFVNCKTEEEVETLFAKLSPGGQVLMELAEYPFSKKFAWVNDKYGVSWQLIVRNNTQKIAPFLMFIGQQHGKAEEAMNFYSSQFKNSNIINIERFSASEGEPEGTVKLGVFNLDGQDHMVMDSSYAHQFTVTPAISFIVNCQTQNEVDEFWEKLSQGGKTSRCGWLEDKYGLSWQIVPTVVGKIMLGDDAEKAKRAMEAILTMDKLNIEALQKA